MVNWITNMDRFGYTHDLKSSVLSGISNVIQLHQGLYRIDNLLKTKQNKIG